MRLQWNPLPRRFRGWPNPDAPATWIVIAFAVSCFCSELILDRFEPGASLDSLALSTHGIGSGRVWQFITCLFVDYSVLQLAVAVTGLYICGGELEPIIGAKQLIGVFLSTGVLGSASALLLMGTSSHQMGVIPAVAGILATYATVLPGLKVYRFLFIPIAGGVTVRSLSWIALASGVSVSALGWLPGDSPVVFPVAMASGWIYARMLGFGIPTAVERHFIERRVRRHRRARMSREQFIAQEIDPILEKISRTGIRSLTREERRILEQGREKIDAEVKH
ncbi:MAG TPA: rhomboid family intramembrane serine protease [Chthoniobacterales bacterium]